MRVLQELQGSRDYEFPALTPWLVPGDTSCMSTRKLLSELSSREQSLRIQSGIDHDVAEQLEAADR